MPRVNCSRSCSAPSSRENAPNCSQKPCAAAIFSAGFEKPMLTVIIDTPKEVVPDRTRATHGLDADIPAHPLVREAMEAFDAIVLKVDRRGAPAPASEPEAEGQA